MVKTWIRVQSVVLVFGLVTAGAAMAQRKVIAPPGDSAVSQYVEDVPTASGGTPSGPAGPSAPAGGAGALTPGQRRALARLGSDGRLAAAVADATAPAGAGAGANARAGGGQAASGTRTGAAGGRSGSAGARSGAPGRNGRPGGARASGPGASSSGAPGARPRLTASALSEAGQISPSSILVRAVGGSDSGSLGLVLIVVMVAGVAAGLVWSLRRRMRV